MATIAFIPSTKQSDRSGYLDMGGGKMLVGTFSVSGSYTLGGDTFATGKNLEDFLKRIGAGVVLWVGIVGVHAEWGATAKKLKLFSGGVAKTEMTATSIATFDGAPMIVVGI